MQRLHQQPQYRADDKGILRHRQQHLAQLGLAAPEVLQHHHRHHVIKRHHNGDHQRRYAEIAAGQQLRGDRQAQQHEVTAEGRLDHHTPALRRFLRQQHNAKGDDRHSQCHAHHKQHVGQAHRLRKIGDVNIIEQHHRHKGVKRHLIEPAHLLQADPAQTLDAVTNGDNQKQRNNRFKCDR